MPVLILCTLTMKVSHAYLQFFGSVQQIYLGTSCEHDWTCGTWIHWRFLENDDNGDVESSDKQDLLWNIARGPNFKQVTLAAEVMCSVEINLI